MSVNNPVAQEILSCISEENHFKELILTPSGNLFINPSKTVEAEEFYLYYKPAVYLDGELHTKCNGEYHTFGKALTSDQSFQLMRNKTEIALLCDGVQLFSKRAGIPVGNTIIAFFRYRQKVVVIIAGDVISRHSHTFIAESDEGRDALMFEEFTQILGCYDPKLAIHVTPSRSKGN